MCVPIELEYVRGLVAGLARDYSGRLTVALSSNDEYEKVGGKGTVCVSMQYMVMDVSLCSAW